MEYKLAKQLKEAGFPQDTEHYYTLACLDTQVISAIDEYRGDQDWFTPNLEKDIACPTLSELIEATKQKGRELSFDECNERWGSKYNHDKGIFERDENGKVIEELKSPYQWEAKLEDWNSKEYGKRRCYEAGDEVVTFAGGKTPEESVARLYIKLNKK